MRQKLTSRVQTLKDLKALVEKLDKLGIPDDEILNPDERESLVPEGSTATEQMARVVGRAMKPLRNQGVVIWVEMDI